MKDHLLFIGATGVLGRAFIADYQNDYQITALSRGFGPGIEGVNEFRANVAQCNWKVVMERLTAQFGIPKYVVYAPYNRKEMPLTFQEIDDLHTEEDIAVGVTGLLKMVKVLTPMWQREDAPKDPALIVVSSMNGIRPSPKPAYFGYGVAKSAQLSVVTNATQYYDHYRACAFCPVNFPYFISEADAAAELNSVIQTGQRGEFRQMVKGEPRPGFTK